MSRWFKRTCRGAGRVMLSVVWDSKSGTISTTRIRMYVLDVIVCVIVYKVIKWIDLHFQEHKTFPDDGLQLVVGIATAIIGGGVAPYMMNRWTSRRQEENILPDPSLFSESIARPEEEDNSLISQEAVG